MELQRRRGWKRKGDRDDGGGEGQFGNYHGTRWGGRKREKLVRSSRNVRYNTWEGEKVVDDTVKGLISKEGRGQMTEEMIWQGIGEGARKSKAANKINERKEVGYGEAHGPTAATKLGLILGLTHSGKEIIKVANNENLNNNGNGSVQNKWRRLARGEDIVVENKEQNEVNKLGKRGAKENEKGEKEEEDQGKRRKVLGEIEANTMAGAAGQPRRVQ